MGEPDVFVESQTAAGRPSFGEHYFRHDCGVPYERNEHWLSFFGRIADEIVRRLEPGSVLDAGCAMGFLVEALHERGVDAWGIDVSEYAISEVADSVRDRCSVASVTEPLPRRYDLVVCIEVLEHLPREEAEQALANLCRSTDRILLSSTPDDFAEPTHVNVQPPEEWSALLAREGFLRDLDHDASYVSPWAALYKRVDEPLAETVRRYDRSWWRLRREAAETRRSLLQLQERLEQIEAERSEGSEEKQAELDRRQEEVLRLRDLLVGQDAELGTARGRIAELEDQVRRLATPAGRLQHRFPRLAKVAGALRRRLRSSAERLR